MVARLDHLSVVYWDISSESCLEALLASRRVDKMVAWKESQRDFAMVALKVAELVAM